MEPIEFLEPYLNKAVLSGDSSSMTIEYDVSVKTYTDTPGINIIQTDLYQMMLVFVQNNVLSQMISTSKQLLYILLNNMKSAGDYTEIPRIYLSLAVKKSLISSESTKEFMAMFSENITIKTINSLTKQKVAQRIENTQDKRKKMSFSLTEKNEFKNYKENLSLYLCVDYSTKNAKSNFGQMQVSGEVILANGKPSKQTFSYYLVESNELWEGKTKKKLGLYVTDEKRERALRVQRHYNTKIIDRRITSESPITEISASPSQVDKYGTLEILDGKYLIKLSDSPIKFVERTSNGINISVDLLGLLRKNSVAYNIIKNIRENELANFNIDEVRVYRKRVAQEVIENTDQIGFLKDFSKDEQKHYLPKNNISIGKNELMVGISINDIHYRQNITTGRYCYGVELYFVDPVVKILESQILLMEEGRKFLEDYYRDSTITGYMNSQNELVEGNYDSETNKMTDSFKNKWNTDELKDVFDSIQNSLYFALRRIENTDLSTVLDFAYYTLMLILPTSTTGPQQILEYLQFYNTILKTITDVYERTKNRNLILEEKYFDRIQHSISRTNEAVPIQQFPFSLLKVAQVQIRDTTPQAERQTMSESNIFRIFPIEAEENYDLLRSVLEEELEVSINQDFSEIRRLNLRPPASIPLPTSYSSVIVDKLNKTNSSSAQAQNIMTDLIKGVLQSPIESSYSIKVSNSSVSEYYSQNSRVRSGNK